MLAVVPTFGDRGYHELLLRTECGKPAAEVVAKAESDGEIGMLDTIMLERALRLLTRSPERFCIGVNVSGITVGEHGGMWISRLAQMRNVSHRIVVELTETAWCQPEARSEFVHECRKLGARIALDDFDVGSFDDGVAASLSPDFVKLGRVFKDAPDGQARSALRDAMAHTPNLQPNRVVVEWVDSREKYLAARSLSIGYLQGTFVRSHEEPGDLMSGFDSAGRTTSALGGFVGKG